MKRFNVILLLDPAGEKVLMCRRLKAPYQGLLNLVGGKAEPGEPDLHAAYRELREETGITARSITLSLLMRFIYTDGTAGLPASELAVFAGRLNEAVVVAGDENPLVWVPLRENFFDMDRFSGEGNIGHMLETARRYHPEMLEPRQMELQLRPVTEDDLAVLSYYTRKVSEEKSASSAKRFAQHQRCALAICNGACMVGTATMKTSAEDDRTSYEIEVFPPFRQCGFTAVALTLMRQTGNEAGWVLEAQNDK